MWRTLDFPNPTFVAAWVALSLRLISTWWLLVSCGLNMQPMETPTLDCAFRKQKHKAGTSTRRWCLVFSLLKLELERIKARRNMERCKKSHVNEGTIEMKQSSTLQTKDRAVLCKWLKHSRFSMAEGAFVTYRRQTHKGENFQTGTAFHTFQFWPISAFSPCSVPQTAQKVPLIFMDIKQRATTHICEATELVNLQRLLRE